MNHLRNTLSTCLAATLALALAACSGGGDDAAGTNLGTSGAQDIGQFRGILESGDIPGENTLDANGFFSEHHVQLPEPDCGQTVCLHSMLSVQTDWVFGRYQATLQVAMSSPVDPSTILRRPHDLVLVIDTSGSMDEYGKIDFVRQGLHTFVDHVPVGDRVALVRYGSDVEVLASLDATMDATALHAIVEELRPAGGTDFYGGLEAGLALAAENADPERTSRVLLLSDGMPTVGITDDPSILAMAEGYIEDGIGITTIGVGTSFNVELMRGLAEKGSGNFYFLEDLEAVDEVFTEELAYFVTPLANDLTIEVVSGAAYTLGEVTGTKAWSTDGFRGAITIPSVFLTSRTGDATEPEGRRGGGSAIFIDMVPTSGWEALADPYRVAELKLTYRDAATGETREQTLVVANPAAPGVAAELPYYSHEAMAKHAAMYNLFLGLREATRYAVYSHNYSLWVLEQLEANASTWNLEREDEDITADLLLVDLFMGNLLERGAQPWDPGDPDTCGYYGCPDDVYYDETPTGGWFGCSAAGQGDPSLLLLLVGAVLGLAIRRRRRA